MSRSGKPAYSKGYRKCIFCSDGGATGEHVYPQWMHSHLNLGPNYGRTELREHIKALPEEDGLLFARKSKIRKTERAVSTKLKIVCGKCNSGWMSGIEGQAREALLRLVRGEPHTIKVADQANLARWMAMKLMLLNEQRPNDPFFDAEEAQQFRLTHKIPHGFQIWIAPYQGAKWRHGWECLRGRLGTPEDASDQNNISTTVLGLEKAIVFGWFSRIDHNVLRFKPEKFSPLDRRMHRLIPAPCGDILWGSERGISDENVSALADSLLSLAQRVGYKQSRRSIRLNIVKPSPNATIWTFETTPCFIGKEFIDLLCGGCGEILGQGISLDTINATLSVPEQFILRCKCGANNLIPVKVIKSNRATK